MFERIFIIGLFCCIQIFLVSMICGLVGLFEKPYIMTLLLLFLLLVLLIVYIHKKKFSEIKLTKSLQRDNISIFEKILISFCFVELGWLFLIGLFFPPRAYDSLWYHLPTVIQWMSHNNMWFQLNTNIYSMVYPKNGEVFFFWNMIFLRTDWIVNLTQLFFSVLGVLCIVLLSMELGLSFKYSLWSAGLFLFTPLIIVGSVICYVDVILLLFVISTLFLFLRYLKTHRLLYLSLAAVSSGLAMGVKYSGIYVPIILILVLVVVNFARHQLLRKKVLYEIVVILLLSSFFGGFWYFTNFVIWHNPFWPLRISLGKIILFNGPMTLLQAIIFSPSVSTPLSYSKWGFFFNSILEKSTHFYSTYSISWKGGFGPQFFVLGIISLVFVLFKSIVSRRGIRLVFLSFFMLLFLISGIKIPRYNLCMACLSSVSVGLMFEYIKNSKVLKILILFIIFYVFVMSFNHDFLTPRLIKDAFNKPLKEKRLMQTCDLFREGEDNYRLCEKVKKHIPLGTNILCAGVIFPYILTENGFRRKLFYILPENKKSWYEKLHCLNIDFVVIKKLYHNCFDIVANPLAENGVLKNELTWMMQDNFTFSIVDSVSNTLIIKVNRD